MLPDPDSFFLSGHSAAANGCACFGIDTNIRQINTVVLNADAAAKAAVIDRLKNSTPFIHCYVQNDRDLNDAIIAGKARVASRYPWIILTASSTT